MKRSSAGCCSVPKLVDAASSSEREQEQESPGATASASSRTSKLPSSTKNIASATIATRNKNSKSNSNKNSNSNNNNNESIWNELGGLSHGSFFRASDSIDSSKRPGVTPAPVEPPTETIRKIVTGSAFVYSPNLTWFLMAAGCWQLVPYDLEPEPEPGSSSGGNHHHRHLLGDALRERLGINLAGAFAYVGFWHWILYGRGICRRPFVPNRAYRIEKVLHNAAYTFLGIVQWTMVEGAFLHLYRSGKLPYANDGDAFSAIGPSRLLLQTLLLSVAVPTYRDVHFYVAHRFLHLRCLYKYVHSVHHRTTDPEPFSGLAMHPVEHLYYYTCYGPLLVLPILFPNACCCRFHPFLLFWMGFHVVLSPAASHSGYEDHFSASLNHYLHHRYCDCNYGAGINLDALFGTYRDALKTEKEAVPASASASPSGDDDCDENENDPPPPPADPKARLGILPEHPLYDLGTYGGILAAFGTTATTATTTTTDARLAAAVLATVGPALWALALSVATKSPAVPWQKACLAPFDKDSTASLVLHLGAGVILGILPATYLVYLVLLPED